MRGENVMARLFNGETKKLIVWDAGRRVIYLCSERVYKQLIAGIGDIPAIGFPKEDVIFIAQK